MQIQAVVHLQHTLNTPQMSEVGHHPTAASQSIESTLPVRLVTDTTPQHTTQQGCVGLWFHTKATLLPLFLSPCL